MFDLDAYQKWTEETAIYPEAKTGNIHELMYLTLGLASESGEMANYIKKLYRDGDNAEKREEIKLELGDVMWYAARLAETLGVNLSDLMDANQKKIQSRQQRGVLGGSGDHR